MKIKIKDQRKKQLRSSDDVASVFQAILKTEENYDKDKEHFWLLILNSKNNIKRIELISLGTLSSSLVHPREVFRVAVKEAAASVVFVHNHPSGDPTPSSDDIEITSRLKKGGELLGIKILDHIVIGNDSDNFFSFCDQKMI